MSHLLALLNEIRNRRLAMYVGATSLTKLADYLRGYDEAVTRLRPEEADRFLADFRDWIYGRFHATANISWEKVILQHSGTEADAVQQFWALLDEFLQQRGGHSKAASLPIAQAAESAPASADRQPRR